MRGFFQFLLAAVKNPLQVSTIFSTGSTVAGVLAQAIPVGGSGPVVELGVGTGAITETLLETAGVRESYLGIEVSGDMTKFARERFPGIQVYEDSAENFAKYLGGKKARAVVSSLPWSLMPQETVEQILNAVAANLAPGGAFSTYLTFHVLKTPAGRRLAQGLSEKFKTVETRFVKTNIPPVKVFICR